MSSTATYGDVYGVEATHTLDGERVHICPVDGCKSLRVIRVDRKAHRPRHGTSSHERPIETIGPAAVKSFTNTGRLEAR